MARTPKAPKTRMNDRLRFAATVALFTHAVVDRAVALAERSDKLATAVFKEMFTPEEHKLLKKMPENWMAKTGGVGGINANGWKVALAFYEPMTRDKAIEHYRSIGGSNRYNALHLSYMAQGREIKAPVIMRDTYKYGTSSDRVDYVIKDTALAEAVQAFSQDLLTLVEDSKTIMAQIESTVGGFTFLEALLEAIPDLNTLAPELKAMAIPEGQALVLTAERLMCQIANVRGEERPGCTAGERDADKPANDEAPAVIAVAA